MFKEGQFLRNKNTNSIYFLLEDSTNNPITGNFLYVALDIKGNTNTAYGQVSGKSYLGLFPSDDYEIVEPEGFKPVEKFYKVGDKFKFKSNGNKEFFYIIAVTGKNNSINLIDIETGLRWYPDSKIVSNWYKVSEKEISDFLAYAEKIN